MGSVGRRVLREIESHRKGWCTWSGASRFWKSTLTAKWERDSGEEEGKRTEKLGDTTVPLGRVGTGTSCPLVVRKG